MRPFAKALTAWCVAAALAAGCATTDERTTGRWTGATIGAIAGGIIGAKEKGLKGAVIGAAAGGAAGYLVGWLVDEYVARRTKTAQQVREEYRLPEKSAAAEPRVLAYDLRVAPSEGLPRGREAEAVSTFDLNAPQGAALTVEEERSLVAPDGKDIVRKRYSYKEVDGAGGYEFRHRMPIPKEADQGRYEYASQLFVNGKPAGSARSGFLVVRGPAPSAVARR